MAESKSDYSTRSINAHSEKIAQFHPLSFNDLLACSERRPRGDRHRTVLRRRCSRLPRLSCRRPSQCFCARIFERASRADRKIKSVSPIGADKIYGGCRGRPSEPADMGFAEAMALRYLSGIGEFTLLQHAHP